MKKYKLIHSLLLFCLFSLLTSFQFPAATGTMEIQVTGLRNNEGVVNLTLFNKEDGFPSDDKKSFQKASAAITNQRSIIIFRDIPQGEYAIALMHDENKNNKMDYKMGMPKEGYGASNDAKAVFGPPKYKDAKFRLDKAQATIGIKMRYF